MTAQKWAVRLSGFATIAILTRFLSPEDFGLVAAGSTVLPFFYMLADLGFAAYIVQVEKADQRMLSTAFWFSSATGLAMCATLVGIAPLLGPVYGDVRVGQVLQLLAITVVFVGVSSVPMALLRRTMHFKALAAQATIAAVLAQVVAVSMTLAGLGVWALVGQALTASSVGCLLACIAVRWRPSLSFSRRDFGAMARFGTNVLGSEFIGMVRQWAEAALISAGLGIAALGLFNIAQRLVQIVQDLTGGAVVQVSVVAFAKLRNSAERLRSGYLRALRLAYAVLLPPLLLVAVGAPLIIPIVFGGQWAGSHMVAQILALTAIMVIGALLDQGVCLGLARPGQWLIYVLVLDTASIAVTVIAVSWGLEAVAAGLLMVVSLATIGRLFWVARLLDTSVRTLVGPLVWLICTVVVGGGAGFAASWLSIGLPSIVRLMVIGFVLLVFCMVMTWFFSRSVVDEVTRYLVRFAWIERVPLLRRIVH